MNNLIKLTCGFVGGTFIGFLGAAELFGAAITPKLLHDASLFTLATAGLCALAIPILRKVFDLQ